MHFCCSELILATLLKRTNTAFVNLKGAFICFILCDTILSSKVFSRFENIALIEQRWDCYQLKDLFSSSFRSFVKISWPLPHFGIVIANRERGVSPTFSQNIIKEKNLSNQMSDVLAKVRCARTRHSYAVPILLCFSDVFLHCFYFKMFLLVMFLKKNCRNPGDTRHCFKMRIRRPLT